MVDIFISYSNKDRSVAQALATVLERRRWSVWWDRKIPIGKSFDDVIEQAIAEARCVIVLWSKNSIASDWVRNEAQEGLRRRILVPVMIDDVGVENLPLSSRRLQSANLANWVPGADHADLQRLFHSVHSILSAPVIPSSQSADTVACTDLSMPDYVGAGSASYNEHSESESAENSAASNTPTTAWRTSRAHWNGKTIAASIAVILVGTVLLSGKTILEQMQSLNRSAAESNRTSRDAGTDKLSATIDVTQKPVIEIIDPPLSFPATSKAVATLSSTVKQRTIIGKANSPAGILSVMVNDFEKPLDNGVFKASVSIEGETTPVRVVAVDKSGARASFEFALLLKIDKPWATFDFGAYYAMIIANQHYKSLPSLDTPINDGRALEKILKDKYGFRTTVLVDANRYSILSELNKLRSELTENDNLLIYYSGHCELDDQSRGNWLPQDAEPDNRANWISSTAITDILNAMSAKHVLVIADSCYSGSMTRSSLARLQPDMSDERQAEWVKAMIKTRSRTVLTSGSLKPVMDGGGEGHSVFAKALIDTLQKNDGLLEGEKLYRIVSSNIVSSASRFDIEQVPQYAPIRLSGHEAGEFFFVPK